MAKHSLCKGIDVSHHHMKRSIAVLPNVVEGVDVALVHIHKCIGGEFLGLTLPSTPLINCSIQLIYIRMTFTKEIKALIAVATNATMGEGTSISVVITSSSCRGN